MKYVKCASTVGEYENQQADFICELVERNEEMTRYSGWDYLGYD